MDVLLTQVTVYMCVKQVNSGQSTYTFQAPAAGGQPSFNFGAPMS